MALVYSVRLINNRIRNITTRWIPKNINDLIRGLYYTKTVIIGIQLLIYTTIKLHIKIIKEHTFQLFLKAERYIFRDLLAGKEIQITRSGDLIELGSHIFNLSVFLH